MFLELIQSRWTGIELLVRETRLSIYDSCQRHLAVHVCYKFNSSTALQMTVFQRLTPLSHQSSISPFATSCPLFGSSMARGAPGPVAGGILRCVLPHILGNGSISRIIDALTVARPGSSCGMTAVSRTIRVIATIAGTMQSMTVSSMTLRVRVGALARTLQSMPC